MINCPNCGAPIVSDKCEYCGTVFHRPSGIAISADCTAEVVSKLVDQGVITVNEARSHFEAQAERIRRNRITQQLYAEAIKAIHSC